METRSVARLAAGPKGRSETAEAERFPPGGGFPEGGALRRALVHLREIQAPALGRSVRDVAARLPAPAVAPLMGAVGPALRPLASPGFLRRLPFLIMVVLPTAVAALYLAFLASNQYTAEMRFAVRGTVQGLDGADEWGQLGYMIRLNNNQESQILASFIRSRGMLDRVATKLDVSAIFNRPALDFWARLGSDPSATELERYWQKMVDVSVEAISGIVTVEVRAFTPEDAMALVEAIRSASEQLVNELTERARRDTMAFAERRLVASAGELSGIRAEFQRYRDQQGVIDAGQAAKSAVTTLTELKRERIKRATELAAARGSLRADAPTLQSLGKRIAVIDESIADLERRLVADRKGEGSASSSPEQRLAYDWLSARSDMAESRLGSAEAALDRARVEVERQQVFLAVFSPAGLPERSSFPHRKQTVLIVFLGSFLIWALGRLLISAVRDHEG